MNISEISQLIKAFEMIYVKTFRYLEYGWEYYLFLINSSYYWTFLLIKRFFKDSEIYNKILDKS